MRATQVGRNTGMLAAGVAALAIGSSGCEELRDRIEDFLENHHPGGPPPPAEPAEPPPVTTLPAGSVCIEGDWCFYHPRPHGLDPADIWASSPHDAWFAVYEAPLLLHADADRWTIVDLPAESSFASVLAGRGPGDVWMAGYLNGDPTHMGIFRRAGDTWQLVRTVGAQVNDLWFDSSGDLWVPAADFSNGVHHSRVHHLDAATGAWAVHEFPQTLLTTVWASDATNVWAAGRTSTGSFDIGVVYHFDGSTWERLRDAVPVALVQKVRGFGADPHNVWLGGAVYGGLGPRLARWQEGDTWQVAMERPPEFNVVELEVNGPDDVWTSIGGVFHLVGGVFQPVDVPATVFHGLPGGARFYAGNDGELWFANGRDTARRLTIGPRQSTLANWGTSADSLWSVGVTPEGGGALLHRTPAGVSQHALPEGGQRATDVWASSDQDIWAVGTGGLVVRGNGNNSTFLFEPSGTTDDLLAVWGSGPDDVWIVGGTTVLHWNGYGFERPDYGGFFVRDVAGTGPDDVWLTGEQLAHLDGGVWSVQDLPDLSLPEHYPQQSVGTAIWANAPDEVFIGTVQFRFSAVWRGDGSGTWTHIAGTSTGLSGHLFGPARGDLWSAGPYLSFHWDGITASSESAVPNRWDARFWGVAPGDMWLSSEGSLLRRQR